MIEVENLTKDYGNFRAVDRLTFTVKKGEILGFLGPNGAGKTTTMRILTCFFPATAGRAVVAGYDCFTDSLEVRRRIGYLPENVPLYRDMNVRDYISFVAGIKGVDSKGLKRMVDKAIDSCGLTQMSHKLVGELSKGYRQRVGLAQALVNDPEVLILDEPTIGLDPRQIIEIRKLIKELAGRQTVILSTHILPEVSMICERVIIINNGKLIAIDTPENLTSKLERSSRVFIKVSGPPLDIIKELETIKGVKAVEHKATDYYGNDDFVVELNEEVDARMNIAPRIIKRGWGLLEMRPQELSLEDIFIKLVTREEGL